MTRNPIACMAARLGIRKSLTAFTLVLATSVCVTISSLKAEGSVAPNSVPANTIITTINVGKGAGPAVVSPDSSSIYVSDYFDNNVSVISAATNMVEKTLFAGSNPEALAISADGSTLYVTNSVSPGTVTVIDLASGTGTKTITKLDPSPFLCALKPNGRRLWVPSGGRIDLINTITNKLLPPIVVPIAISGLAFTPDGLKAYLTSRFTPQLSVLNTAKKTVSATIRVGYHAGTAIMSPTGEKAYIGRRVHREGDEVSVIDTTQDKIINSISLGSGVIGGPMAFLPGGQYLYVLTNSGISMIDTQSNTIAGTFAVPFTDDATSIAIAPNGTRAYISEINNTVTVIGIQ